MKLPIILKSTHDEVVAVFESKLAKVHEDRVRTNDELAAANITKDILQNRNTELNVKLAVVEKKTYELEEQINEHKEYAKEVKNQKEQLENSVHELHQDILDYEATIKEFTDRIKSLEFCNEESKKEIGRLKALLKVNGIAKQQLRDLCLFRDNQGRYLKNENGEVLVNENVNGLKIWDLTVLLGE